MKMANGRCVAYYRVSTLQQGQSGLGLEGQQHAVGHFLNGGDWALVASFIEIESGKKSDRPELMKALAACRRHRATLIISKLDRLARNVAFTANLMESSVDFIALDNLNASRMNIHILAAVAEDEARRISERTIAALAAAKRRGQQLGTIANLQPGKYAARGGEAMKAKATAAAIDLAPVIDEARSLGHTTIREIQDWLNGQQIPSSRGGEWSYESTRRLLGMLAA